MWEGKNMKTWQDADKVLKGYNEQLDHEYLFGSDSIHAKYTKFIAEREARLREDEVRIAAIRAKTCKRKPEEPAAEAGN